MRRSLEIMNVMLAPDESEDVTVRQFDRLFTSLDRARQLDERISDLRKLLFRDEAGRNADKRRKPSNESTDDR